MEHRRKLSMTESRLGVWTSSQHQTSTHSVQKTSQGVKKSTATTKGLFGGSQKMSSCEADNEQSILKRYQLPGSNMPSRCCALVAVRERSCSCPQCKQPGCCQNADLTGHWTQFTLHNVVSKLVFCQMKFIIFFIWNLSAIRLYLFFSLRTLRLTGLSY